MFVEQRVLIVESEFAYGPLKTSITSNSPNNQTLYNILAMNVKTNCKEQLYSFLYI